MSPDLLPLLACPHSHAPLKLVNAKTDKAGNIVSGVLVSTMDRKRRYPIVRGIPRFVPQSGDATAATVDSFGDQWNHFNYDRFEHTWKTVNIGNTFGSTAVFKGKTVVDAGAGSGMMSRWMIEAGARRVIALELSHTVDGIMKANHKGLAGIDVIQCSIDAIPLRDGAIKDLVLCTNVIQHTPSVQRTARELWRITGKGGEFAFNVYNRNDSTPLHRLRNRLYRGVRAVVSRWPFRARMAHAQAVGALAMVPGLGRLLEKLDLMRQGEVTPGGGWWTQFRRRHHAAVLNTFDYFGAHAYQHHLSFDEVRALATALQPDRKKHVNAEAYFSMPHKTGTMLRLRK
jgi:SAM-dependent methyltransferase